jgi:hypothetical protein
MRYSLSLLLYYIGDIISLTSMMWFNGLGFKLYQKVMLLSVDLDKEGKIWKHVKPKRRNKNVKKNSRFY